jgi:uncharacterized protein (TIGR02453 family)
MAFEGFPKGGDRFFQELAVEQNREWFLTHKGEYEALWLRPMEALLSDVRTKILPAFKALGLAEPKVFRIHRDVRFSKDKTPYKTHIAGVIMTGKSNASEEMSAKPCALYVSLGDHEGVGSGSWHLEPDQLARWRKLLLDKKKGAELDKILKGKKVEGHSVLQRVPRGFPEDHPRAHLAKMKGVTITFPDIPRGLIHKPAFSTWLTDHARSAAPLCTWISKNVR